ncbi:MAG: molybdenum cofactor guanylyltransferase [Longimicrobiales bacterium]
MSPPSHDVIGFIIAGGQSTRYGSPKALADVAGERVVDRVERALRAVTSEVLLIANDAALAEAIGIEARRDRVPGLGPIGGLDAALAWAAELGAQGIVVAGCDMPFLPPSLFASILDVARATDADAVLPESDGPRGVEPLAAYYSVSCVPAIEAAISREDQRLIAFHRDVRVERLPLEDVRRHGDPAHIFMNLNTTSDRERADAIARNS